MKTRQVLVIAAHPDDEVLGCGATVANHAQQGDDVHVVILAEGVTSRDLTRNRECREAELSKLAESAHAAKNILGIRTLSLHDFPDNRMDSVDFLDIVKVVEQYVDKYKPAIVYTHHGGDLNLDHRLVHKAVVTACRGIPLHPVKTLLFFETPSSTEWQTPGSAPCFTPNWFVDISHTLDAKLKALKAYESEMHSWPHPRSYEAIRHMACWRGATVGVDSAEAFMVGRNLVSLEPSHE